MDIRWMLLVCSVLSRCCLAIETKPTKEIEQLRDVHGLCIQVGANLESSAQIAESKDVLLHLLDSRAAVVVENRRAIEEAANGSVIVETWTKRTLPHADNIANFVLVEDQSLVAPAEIERVLAPGGVSLIRKGDGYVRTTKRLSPDIDEWTHQWHDVDGGLTTNDQQVGVPQGIRWLSGPLFAMAGRKSSTQTLVSSGGLNFYLTQNVLENVGLPAEQMQQFLVARDAYNGLVRWQRQWTGTFVTGNGETNPRMVASHGRLYATNERGLLRLDPKSGATIAEIELAEEPEKIVVHAERVFLQDGSTIRTFDPELKNEIWEFEGKNLSGFVLNDHRCFLLSSGRSKDGRFQHDLICLNPETGDVLWRTNTQPYVEAARVRINFVADDFAAIQAHGSLHIFSIDDGKHLWSKETDARPGKTYVDERYVGHFYRRGLVWMLSENSPREADGQNVWLGLDPRTGEVARTLKTKGNWPRTDTPAKMGCQVLIASDRYIMIPRQATFVDFETGEKLSFKFTRGGCGLGFVPANGLVYSHPHACGCYSDALRGFMGMHSRTPKEISGKYIKTSGDERLTAMFQPTLNTERHASDDWPTYRGNGSRGGYSKTKIGTTLSLAWSKPVGSPDGSSTNDSISGRAWRLRTGNAITPPTIASGMAFAADIDRGRLRALNIDTGEEAWSFAAAGRIDSPPTIHQGLCLFGSHDGYVYCLNATNGKLAWKFRAAPVDRRIVAFGSVESTWPVAGTVLVQNGVAFVAAGRAPDADGGIEVHALDPLTGKAIWSSKVDSSSFRGLADYLVGGEEAIYLGNQRFDPKTGTHEEVSLDSPHLRGGKVGLLEASWTKHDLALRKEIQTWKAAGIEGQLLAFAPDVSAAYNFEAKQILVQGDENEHMPVETPRQITGMAITNDHLVVAGGLDRSNPSLGGFLQVVDLSTGDMAIEKKLSSEPVFDGVALANGDIYVSTQDGVLHRFASNDTVAQLDE